jgi:hypothetical protein
LLFKDGFEAVAAFSLELKDLPLARPAGPKLALQALQEILNLLGRRIKSADFSHHFAAFARLQAAQEQRFADLLRTGRRRGGMPVDGPDLA